MKTGFKSSVKLDIDKKFPNIFKTVGYDERSGPFIKAGNDHGVGPKQPVGSKGEPKKEGVPMGRIDTLKLVD